jgi:hypothetical protein
VVELFTSEGCSSCPPADTNLATIARRYAGRPVFALSFHVDYWNRLGWTDPFSNAAYSARQRRYVRALGTGGTYTPQMIINGSVEVVGSHAEAARRHIDEALRAAPTDISLELTVSTNQRQLVAQYESRGPLSRHWVCVVAMDPQAQVSVPRGENGGRILDHVNVVRALVTRVEDGPTRESILLRLPHEVDPNAVRVVGYLQDPDSLRILAARGASRGSGRDRR